MALVVKGRIVPISNDPTVAPDDQASFAGRVRIGDDGRIAAVTRGQAAGPPVLADAPVVDVGTRLVVPGLIDLHNHLALLPMADSAFADGVPIEDLGISGISHAMSRRDLLDGNPDLLAFCADLFPAPAVPAVPAAPRAHAVPAATPEEDR
jgi:imidazolonepropionase-like amidohydrolase